MKNDEIRISILRALSEIYDREGPDHTVFLDLIAERMGIDRKTLDDNAIFLEERGFVNLCPGAVIELTSKGYDLVNPDSPFARNGLTIQSQSITVHGDLMNSPVFQSGKDTIVNFSPNQLLEAMRKEVSESRSLSEAKKKTVLRRVTEFFRHPAIVEALKVVLERFTK